MSAIYLPPSFCGLGAKLRLRKEFKWKDLFLPVGSICFAKRLIGFKYYVTSEEDSSFEIPFLNGEMDEYFEILKYGNKPWIVEQNKEIKSGGFAKYRLKRDLIIKDVVSIETGTKFYVVEDKGENKVFFNLHDVSTYECLIRLSKEEFIKYCEKLDKNENDF